MLYCLVLCIASQSDFNIRRTDSLVNTLGTYVIHTGLLTSYVVLFTPYGNNHFTVMPLLRTEQDHRSAMLHHGAYERFTIRFYSGFAFVALTDENVCILSTL